MIGRENDQRTVCPSLVVGWGCNLNVGSLERVDRLPVDTLGIFFRCVILYLISKLFLLKIVICVYAFENVQTV